MMTEDSLVETTHIWRTDKPIPSDVQSSAEDKLNDVLNGNVVIDENKLVWYAPTAVIPEAAVDSVHDETDLDEDDTTYSYVN